jgi:hypothetical protein
VADGVLNVALFLPLGWALGRWLGVVPALIAGLAVSLGVEVLQIDIPGRHPSVSDLVFNSAGAGLGAWLGRADLRRLARLVPALAVAALVGLLAPMVLLAPAPPDRVYYGQWTARFGTMEPYLGRVLDAAVGGIALPDGRSEESPMLRRHLERRSPIEVTFVAGPPPPGLAPLLSVYDDERREVFLLGIEGDDLVFRQRSRATDLGLDAPELRLSGALEGVAPGDTATAVLTGAVSSPCMSLNRRTQCDIAPGFGAGWTLLLYPPPMGESWSPVVDLLWVGALALPLGWWLGRRSAALSAAACLVLVLLAFAWWSPHTRPTPWVATALLAGAWLGAWLKERPRGHVRAGATRPRASTRHDAGVA